MDRGYYEPNADINPALLRELLLGISVSPDIGMRLGVPVDQLEQWLRDLADRVDDRPRFMGESGCRERAGWMLPRQGGGLLSAGEISFLLEGFDEAHAVGS